MATLPRNNRLEVSITPPGGDTGLQSLGHFGPKSRLETLDLIFWDHRPRIKILYSESLTNGPVSM